jgi:hypothetical protein
MEYPSTNLQAIQGSYSAIRSLLAMPDEKIEKLSEYVLDYYKQLYEYNDISIFSRNEIYSNGYKASYKTVQEDLPNMLICLDKMLKDFSAIYGLLQDEKFNRVEKLLKKRDKIIPIEKFPEIRNCLDKIPAYIKRTWTINEGLSAIFFHELSMEEKYHLFHVLPTQLGSLLGDLEFYLGGAKMVKEGHYSIPTLTEESGIIQVKGAWNPVAGKYEDMDKLDIDIGTKSNFLGITGPNEVGKSTTIEMIALCVLYFQMGLPIPAEAGTIGVFKNIYTVTPILEGVNPGESHHTGLIKRLTDLIDKVGPRDIVIVDEAHMGSEFKDLSALTTVLMEDLVKKGATILYATHMRNAMELLANRIPHIQPYKLEYEIDRLKPKPVRALTPGITKGSFSSHTLKRAGFPEFIIKWTEEYYDAIMRGEKVKTLTEFPEETFSRPIETVKSDLEIKAYDDVQDREIFCKARDVLFPKKNFYYDYEKADELWNNSNPDKTQESFKKWNNVKTDDLREFRRVLFDDMVKISEFSADLTPELLRAKTRNIKGKVSYYYYEKDEDMVSVYNKEIKRIESLLINNLKNKIKILVDIKASANFNCNRVIAELRKKIDKLEAGMSSEEELVITVSEDKNKKSLKEQFLSARSTILKQYEKFMDDLGGYGLVEIDFLTGTAISMRENKLNFWEDVNKGETFILRNAKSPFIPGAIPVTLEGDTRYPVFAITGPNKSGKTSLVRALQVINSFRRRGLPIPADIGSKIPEYDKMLTFFGGEEDLAKGESYFRSVAERLMYIIKNASSKSLIIMDELHGSDYWELSALQAALIRYFNKVGATVVLNTHMREGLIIAGKTISCKFLKTDVTVAPDGEIIYHYSISEDRNLEAKSLGIETVREHLKTEERYQRALKLREFFYSQCNSI